MSVRVVPRGNRSWEVDIRLRLPNGKRHRERRVVSHSAKSAAQRWGEDRQRHLLLHGPAQPKKEVLTLEEFAPTFLDRHARANRQKPSGIASKEMLLRLYLIPFLGRKRLDAIANEDVERLKQSMEVKAAKTVNNVLAVLSVMLKKAVEWQVIQRMPCTIRLLRVPKPSPMFHDFAGYERLVEVAHDIDHETLLIVLLGGEAGLRCGEMIALEWADVNLAKPQLCIQRSDWNGHVSIPKGGRLRYVRLTNRLAAALTSHRHLRSSRVLCQRDGAPLTRQQIQYRIKRAARTANVPQGVHLLRHTFCSHLAMRGAPAAAIQELAGHTDLSTTQRYIHLSPAVLDSAIRLLESSTVPPGQGTVGEAVGVSSGKGQ